MTARAFRNTLFRLHGWIGLNLSLLMFLIFLTGTLMVFVDEIASAVTPGTHRSSNADGPSASFGDIYQSVRTAYPDVGIDWITRNNSTWRGDQVHVSTAWGDPAWVWTDPATAEVLGTTPDIGLRRTIRDFHVSLMTQRLPGRLVVLSLVLALVVMIVSGLVTYRRFWRGLFRWPRGPVGTRGWWGGVHRLAALWSLPFSLAIVLTSLYFLAGNFGMTPDGPQRGAVSERSERLPSGFDAAAFDRAIASAQAAVPGLHPHFLRLPDRADKGIEINGSAGDAFFALDHVQVWVDPVTFDAVSRFRVGDAPFGSGMKDVAEALHYGTWGGGPSRWAWFGFGLLGTALSLSGTLVFAARIAPGGGPVGPGTRGLPRIWRGISVLKWPLVLGLVAAVSLWMYKVAEIVPQWSRVYLGPPPGEARLSVKGAPHADRALPMRAWVAEGAPGPAILSLDGTDYAMMLDQAAGGGVAGTVTVTATAGPNAVTLRHGDGDAPLTWRLGRPLN